MKIIKKIYGAMPPYGWLCAICMTSWNFLIYFGSRVFTTGLYHHDIETDLDRALPFIPAFVIIYIFGSYAQWIYGYYLVLREDRVTAVRVAKAEIIAEIICLVCFFVYPTTMGRPEVVGDDIFANLMRWLYDTDASDNLFPSVHCIESYMIMRTCFWAKTAPKWYRPATIIMSILVFLSTFFCKQHVLADFVGAVICVEIGLFISRRVKWFEK